MNWSEAQSADAASWFYFLVLMIVVLSAGLATQMALQKHARRRAVAEELEAVADMPLDERVIGFLRGPFSRCVLCGQLKPVATMEPALPIHLPSAAALKDMKCKGICQPRRQPAA